MRVIFLYLITLPLQAETTPHVPSSETVANFSQLPSDLSLRDLQKVCHRPDIKEQLDDCRRRKNFDAGLLLAELRHKIRVYMLERSLELEKKMALFYSHSTFPQTHFSAANCSAVDAKDRQRIEKEKLKLEQTKTHLRDTLHLRWRDNMRTMLTVSYELMFIKHVLLRGRWRNPRTRNWQRPPFWLPDVKKIKLLSFPPIFSGQPC